MDVGCYGRWLHVSLICWSMLVAPCIAQFCPTSQCECILDEKQRPIIYCSRPLTAIPQFHHSEVTYYELNLARTRSITTLPANAFKTAAGSTLKVERITVTGNPITSIDRHAFDGLSETLVHLVLHVNAMPVFPTEALSVLTNLNSLELQGFSLNMLPPGSLQTLNKLEDLRIVQCRLTAFRQTDVQTQRNSLRFLNLEGNQLSSVPKDSITSLQNLNELNLRENKITTLNADSFNGASKLSALNISGNSLSIKLDAFRGLEATLNKLELSKCALHDTDLSPIRTLHKLTYLDLGYNDIGTIPDGVFSHMGQLSNINLHGNQLTHITVNTFRGSQFSLKTLTLAENAITRIEDNSFQDYRVLDYLDLDHQDLSSTLNANTFKGLGSSLTFLSLKETSFSSPQNWQSIKILRGLKTLMLPNNKIQSIPELIFKDINKLTSLDLSYNLIPDITQKMMHGLEKTLHGINLRNNRISTISRCTFYQFTNLKRMDLHKNPLLCDCRLRWLREWLDTSGETLTFVTWSCENTVKYFKDMRASDLTCSGDTSSPQCEELLTTTTTTTSTTTTSSTPPTTLGTLQPLLVNTTNVTPDSIEVVWVVEGVPNIKGFQVEYWNFMDRDSTKTLHFSTEIRSCTLTNLEPATNYVISVQMLYGSGSGNETRQSFAEEKTNPLAQPVSDSNTNLGLILGCALGGAALLIILGVIIFVCVRISRRNEDPFYPHPQQTGIPKRDDMPTAGYSSKRFSKPKGRNTVDVQNMDNVRLEEKLDGFSKEERDRILKLLSTSGASTLSMLSTTSNPRYVRERELPHRPFSMDGTYMNPLPVGTEYEEIPADEVYDQIPTDDYI